MQREQAPARVVPLHPLSETTTRNPKRRRPHRVLRQDRKLSSHRFHVPLLGKDTSARTALARFHRMHPLERPCRNRPELAPLLGRGLPELPLQPQRSPPFHEDRPHLWLSKGPPTQLLCGRRQLLHPQQRRQAVQEHYESGFSRTPLEIVH